VARIYDVRFAGYVATEATRIAAVAGLAPGQVRHRMLDERLVGLRVLCPHHHRSQPEGGDTMTDEPTTATDPVCGMTVDIAAAREKGLTSTYQDRETAFCGRGCKPKFDDDPERYLSTGHVPSIQGWRTT
jgi:YHS domain-containing protein